MIRDVLDRVVDPDRALMRATAAAVDAVKVRHALDLGGARYRPGEPLKLLLAGYAGMRNTGSDVRVEEIVRQLRTVLGDDQVELSVLSVDPARTAGYFRTARQVHLPALFPRFLFEECPRHHGVIGCEGSMFKSKFTNALTVMMAGALGMAAAESKLSLGYGAEAGSMTPALQDFVRKHCRHSLILCRNEPSRSVLDGMGIRSLPGTDTAWTFEPAPIERGRELLRKSGWDGVQPVLALCPINPFWWPIRPDLLKATAHALGGQFRSERYLSIYFHHTSEEVDEKLAAYLDGLAEAANAYVQERNAYPVIVGTEMLDRVACEGLAERLGVSAPVFVSDELDMFDLVSVLRNASLMVSSRFHAMVTSMPAGVPSIGVTMDERIHNLMHDRGHPELLFRVEEDGLGEKLLSALRRAERDSERIRRDVRAFVPGQIRRMGEMGIELAREVQRVYPDFPARDVAFRYEHFIPPLSPALERLMGEYA